MNQLNFQKIFRTLFFFILIFSQTLPAQTNNDWEKLCNAVRQCNLNLINQLQTDSIDINYQDKAGWTVLHWWNFSLDFSYTNFVKTLRVLINSGVDVNLADTRGRNALMLLLTPGDDQPQTSQLEAIKILVDAGTDIYSKNEFGESAMSLGLESRFSDVSEYFKMLRVNHSGN